MPKEACPKPSGNMKRDNNFYLKSLKVKVGGRNVTLISSNELCYQKSFTVDAGGADSVKITAKKASVTDAMSESRRSSRRSLSLLICHRLSVVRVQV
jgi:hypothetical protein